VEQGEIWQNDCYFCRILHLQILTAFSFVSTKKTRLDRLVRVELI